MRSPFRHPDGSSRLSPLKISGILLFMIMASLLVFSGIEKSEIAELMDARDMAISQRSIPDYSALIYSDYNDQGRSKVDAVAQMVALFDKFDRATMRSHDRHIQQLDDNHAICDQSYTLKVLADGKWRQIVQREQLTLTKDSGGWKISSGL